MLIGKKHGGYGQKGGSLERKYTGRPDESVFPFGSEGKKEVSKTEQEMAVPQRQGKKAERTA